MKIAMDDAEKKAWSRVLWGVLIGLVVVLGPPAVWIIHFLWQLSGTH